MESSPSPVSNSGIPPGPGNGPSRNTNNRQVYPAMSIITLFTFVLTAYIVHWYGMGWYFSLFFGTIDR